MWQKTLIPFAAISSWLIFGCMDDLYNYEECKQIESARCELREDCRKQDSESFSKTFKDFDYETCIAYANEHCRTRKIGAAESDWGGDDVEDCVNAILGLSLAFCSQLKPSVDETEWEQISGKCWFIEETEEDSTGADGGTDTSSDGG